jgi:putative phage-type endonuclease
MLPCMHDLLEKRWRKSASAQEQLVHERQTMLGGSDMVHLLGIEPWGCQRLLCYAKTGIIADFPLLQNADMRRGSILEPVAVAEYERATARLCRRKGLVEGREPWERVHLDRQIVRSDARGPGVLEVKVPRSTNYAVQTSQQEAPEGYRVQLQWAMAVTGWKWGSIWVWNADTCQGRFWDYAADRALQADMRAMGRRFWQERQEWIEKKEFQIDPFPHVPRLELRPSGEPDRRCLTCSWRRKCQGIGELPEQVIADAESEVLPYEYDESLAEIANDYLYAKGQAKAAEAELDVITDALKAALGERSRVECSVARISSIELKPVEFTTRRAASTRLQVRAK